MRSKIAVRLLVILSFLIAVATLAQEFRFDVSSTTARVRAAGADRDLAAVAVTLSDFRAAETAYLAAGQNQEFWTKRASDLAAQVEGELTRLRGQARSTDGSTHLDAALTAFSELMAADTRARANLAPELILTASDIVLSQSLEVAQRVGNEVGAARTAESRASEAEAERVSRLRLATAGGGMILVLACALLAIAIGRQVQSAASPAATMAQMLRELPPPVRTSGSAHAAAAHSPVPVPAGHQNMSPAPTGTSTHIPARPVLPAMPANLPDAAELCVDLARVMDARDIPALLQRTANVLEAKGVIVWLADPGGTTLQPLLTHGYPERVVRRLGTLEADADNVTSLAFRSLRAQTMNATAGADAGAVAIPLVTASGCTGVLAAEVKQHRPGPETVALARIIAAQLATIIGPLESSASEAEPLARATAD